MQEPSFLRKGDKIAIIAPARKISVEEVAPAIEILESWGLEAVMGKNLHAACHQFAGTDEQRAEDLINAFADESIKAVLCARGGYGTIRTLSTALRQKPSFVTPKWLIGYSDITVLHSYLNKTGIMSLHATMPVNFEINTPDTLNHLKKLLFGQGPVTYEFEGNNLNVPGYVEAEIAGGNLSVIYSLRGTAYETNYDGKILFIEDLDEYLYHIDRMMMNLKTGGVLNRISGMLVGDMPDMHDNTVPFGKDACEIIYEHVAELGIPVGFIKGIGHLKKNLPLVLGRSVKMSVEKEKTVLFL